MVEKKEQEKRISTNSGIYQIQSIIHPEREYIGSAVNVRKRRHHHWYSLRKNIHENQRLQNHFNKYGEDDFLFSVLLECSKESLITNEQHFINLNKPYFNICLVAGSSLGCIQSDECKRKVSIANKGRKHTEESKRNMGDAGKGRVFSQEHRQNISKGLKGKPKSEKAKESMSRAAMGRTMSEESSRKKSVATKGKPHSEEHNYKGSLAITEWWHKKKKQNCEVVILEGEY